MHYVMPHLPFSQCFSACLTLVCLPSGENSSCCSCENGYAWPSAVCSDLITCPSISQAPNLPCGYVKEAPFLGPYCEPQTEGKEKQRWTSSPYNSYTGCDKAAHEDWAGYHITCGDTQALLFGMWVHLDPSTWRYLVPCWSSSSWNHSHASLGL